MLAGMSAVMPSGMLVDMSPIMLPDIPFGIPGVRSFGMPAMKSEGRFVPAGKYNWTIEKIRQYVYIKCKCLARKNKTRRIYKIKMLK